MKWLISASRSLDAPSLAACLLRHGATLDARARQIPLGPDEYVVAAEGPADLAERLAGEPGIVGIHPNSEQTPY
jgi:hypothetical protein